MPGFLLDANILIKALRKQPAALDLIDSLWAAQEAVWISVLSRTEVLAGMHPLYCTRSVAAHSGSDVGLVARRVGQCPP
jgi:predicted nucleic acid-binding protein